MLQNAVHPLKELRQVKITADQNKVLTGTDLTYEEYFKLVSLAAITYDAQFKRKTHFSKAPSQQSAFMHDLVGVDDDAIEPVSSIYDIDTDIATIWNNMASQSVPGSCLPPTQWEKLSDDAKDIWKTMSAEDRAVILGSITRSTTGSSTKGTSSNSNVQCSSDTSKMHQFAAYVYWRRVPEDALALYDDKSVRLSKDDLRTTLGSTLTRVGSCTLTHCFLK